MHCSELTSRRKAHVTKRQHRVFCDRTVSVHQVTITGTARECEIQSSIDIDSAVYRLEAHVCTNIRHLVCRAIKLEGIVVEDGSAVSLANRILSCGNVELGEGKATSAVSIWTRSCKGNCCVFPLACRRQFVENCLCARSTCYYVGKDDFRAARPCHAAAFGICY